MKEEIVSVITKVIILAVVVCFTVFGFLVPSYCDGIDNATLYCRLHPFKIIDLIGCVIFYGGAVMISGVLNKFFTLSESKWTFIFFGVLVVGFILIYA